MSESSLVISVLALCLFLLLLTSWCSATEINRMVDTVFVTL